MSFIFPPSIKEKIQAIPFQEHGSGEDVLLWKFTKDGDFSSNSAYLSLMADSGEVNTFKGAWIWKIDTLPKIISFLWLCMHKSMPVRNVLANRGINCSRLCPVCRNQVESIDHLLRVCVFAQFFWSRMEVSHLFMARHTQSLEDWLYENCLNKRTQQNHIPWGIIFPFATWNLWKHRNRVMFDNAPLNLNLHSYCLTQAVDFFYCVGTMRKTKQRTIVQVKWFKPPAGWFKLNSDGASCGNPGKAGGGVLIRDCNGLWIKGFARSIGYATSITAEFWASRDGLKLAFNEGIQQPIVELDAKVVVDLIKSNATTNNPYAPFLYDCRYLLTRFIQVQVVHVYTEGNRCADALAKWGSNMTEAFAVFDRPPSSDVMYLVISMDNVGMLVNRVSELDPNSTMS